MATDWLVDTDTDVATVLLGVRAMLRLAGEDPDRAGVANTPARFVRAWQELTGRPGDPAALLGTVFDDAADIDEMVVSGPIEFSSVCEHHLLPFHGHAWVGYMPGGVIVGLSKLARLVEHYARRPQVQERLTQQVTGALDTYVPGSQGAACVLRAVHTCSSMRGVRKVSTMTTSSLTGSFRSNAAARAEFLAWVRDDRLLR